MTSTVTEFAPAKINLALHVLGRRADGYHEFDSVVAFADVGDALELQPATAELSLTVDGPFAEHVPVTADNLVLRAHAALAQLLQHTARRHAAHKKSSCGIRHRWWLG